MTIKRLVDAHLSVIDRVYHYKAPTAVVDSGEPYLVWGETGITDLSADDGPAEWAVDGISYYYTRREYDEDFDRLCQALADAGIAFRPGRIGWDDTTETMTYEIAWSVAASPCGAYAVDTETEEETDEQSDAD